MIQETIARVKSVPALLLVEGAAGFAAAADAKPRAIPAAYVLRLHERGLPSPTYMRVEQRVPVSFGIVLCVRNVGDAKGGEASNDLDAIRKAVLGVILGWAPTGCDPCQFDSGALLGFKDGYLWWQDIYRTTYDITQ